MNFKDLQFSIGKLKADVHSQIAKNNPLQKQDTKALSMWIFQERNDLATMRTKAYKQSETIKALKEWVKEEVAEETIDNSRDLEDLVGDKLCRLLDKQIEIEQEFAAKYQQYRHAIKSIREREEKLADEREKKRTLQARIANLQKSSPKSPKLTEFQKELRSLTQDTVESEFDLADFKRFALKEAFYLRFNAMHEFAEKTALIAGFGKYLTDLIDTEPTIKAGQPRLSPIQRKPYVKGAEAAMIVADAMNAIQQWKPLAEDERPTLANSNGSVTALSVVSNDSSISHSHAKSDDSTGDFPAASEQPIQQRVPPALPPRRLTEEGTANTPTTPTTAHDEIPPPLPPKTSHVSPSLVNSTGDLKTKNEVGIDSAAYEAPPPAYEEKAGKASTAAAAQRGTIHSSISDHKNLPVPPPHIPAHQGQHHTAHLSMSYDPPHSPEPSSAAAAVTTSSPLSTHSQTVFESPLLHQQQSSSTSFHDPTKASTSVNSQQQFQIDYHHLYHRQYQQQQQQQQQQQYPYYRPYSEFQQQVHHHQQQQQQQQQRPRIDAGGFRIPPTSSSTFMSAEEEKERLAHYYRQQQQQPSSFASHTLNNNQSSSKSSHYEQKTQE